MGDRGLSSVSCCFNTGHAGNLLRGGSWVLIREIVQIVSHAATCDSLWGMIMQASTLQPLAGSQPLICEWSHYFFRSVLTPPEPYERRRRRTKSLCPTRTHPPS